MNRKTMRRSVWLTLVLLAVVAAPAMVAVAQTVVPPNPPAAAAHHFAARALSSNVIVPQARVSMNRERVAIQVTRVDVGVVILEQVATTTMDISVRNVSGRREEAELIVPVPEGVAVRGFTFAGSAAEPTAELLPKDVAKSTYESIVAKVRDPALLEFAGYNLIRTSVFPVEAGGEQKVRLTYEHLLPADGARVDYVLPRSEAVDYTIPWTVAVRIKSREPISTVYSPSHEIQTTRQGETTVSVKVTDKATTEPGAFRLSYLIERDGVTASLIAYPNSAAGDGGYFLLLAGLPPKLDKNGAAPGIRREVTLVLDRSGSMRGEKLEQVIEAARQTLAGLSDGESFNILTYNEQVDLFAAQPQLKSKETLQAADKYLGEVTARGGTNIHDALLEALRQKPTEGYLPIVLFLTDGLPTVGQTSEAAITRLATASNPHHRRVFSFGVGVDVNTPLLEKIAVDTRAVPTFVLPKEDVEVKVSQVFRRLVGPVLADPELVAEASDKVPGKRVQDVLPGKLPDLFEGDQLVVLGRYSGTEPLEFTLKGNYLGNQRTFHFKLGLDKATTRNAFVPRLWASRKIALLTDAIRALGADVATKNVAGGAMPTDPRLKELVDEIVRLSTEFGILTEYTAFLAREGTDLSRRDNVLAEATGNFKERAINTRSGLSSINQSVNNDFQRQQISNNSRNGYYDQGMNRVEITTVQQVNDQAFYRRGNRWVDGRVATQAAAEPKTVIEFGSAEFNALVDRLAAEGRQGSVSLEGEIVLVIDGQSVLIKPPAGK